MGEVNPQAEAVARPTRVPFADHLGFELRHMRDGEAEIFMPFRQEWLNTWGVAHGGVIMTLLDVTMAHAARSLNLRGDDPGPGIVTIEMKTQFMRPGEGDLLCKARVLHRSSTMAFTEGRIWNASGELASHATGTFKYLRALPAAGRQLKQRATGGSE